MYEPDTILVLKEPRGTRREPHPYDRVRVIGVSPNGIAATGRRNRPDYSGRDATALIIQPVSDFGATVDEPFGWLKELYDVESVPEHEVVREAAFRVIKPTALGPTPEEVFAAEAKKQAG